MTTITYELMHTYLVNTYDFNGKLDFCIKSDNSNSEYIVRLCADNIFKEYDIKCTCGLKFGIGPRDKCKHINIIKNHIRNDLITENNILNIFEKLTIN